MVTARLDDARYQDLSLEDSAARMRYDALHMSHGQRSTILSASRDQTWFASHTTSRTRADVVHAVSATTSDRRALRPSRVTIARRFVHSALPNDPDHHSISWAVTGAFRHICRRRAEKRTRTR
eukprot:2808817-Prymnesium_polylepis.1